MSQVAQLPLEVVLFLLVAVLGLAGGAMWKAYIVARDMRTELNAAMGSIRKQIKEESDNVDGFRLEVTRNYVVKEELRMMMDKIDRRFDTHETRTANAIEKIERHFGEQFSAFRQELAALLGSAGHRGNNGNHDN